MTTKNKRSPIWQFFEISSNNKKFSVCLLCGVLISRGVDIKKAGTSAMINHVKMKHPKNFQEMKKGKASEDPSLPDADGVPEFLDINSPVSAISHSHRKSSRSGSIKLSKLLKADTTWLMELEQRRMKVEEKLASAAVITAEASRIQAEASRMQAEAMVNLVKLLENKNT